MNTLQAGIQASPDKQLLLANPFCVRKLKMAKQFLYLYKWLNTVFLGLFCIKINWLSV